MSPYCHDKKILLSRSGNYIDDKGVVRFWFETGDKIEPKRRRYICIILNDIDHRHSTEDEKQGRPQVFSKERQTEKREFADGLSNEDEKRYAHDWITNQ